MEKNFETVSNTPKTLEIMNASTAGWIFVTYQKK